jgi:hypothetical protein
MGAFLYIRDEKYENTVKFNYNISEIDALAIFQIGHSKRSVAA